MKKRDRHILIGFFAILAVALLLFFVFKKAEVTNIVNNGVAVKALIVDENGNIRMDLSKQQPALAIISAPTPSGYLSLSPHDCVSGCSFLALETKIDNSGDSQVTISDVEATTSCDAGNTDPDCISTPNTLGLPTSSGNRRGNLNALWDAYPLPLILPKTAISSPITSNGMALDEIANLVPGAIKFTLALTGTFVDPYGSSQPLLGKYGSLSMNIAPSKCSDGTNVDPDSTDDDVDTYCSSVQQGKYCRVGYSGQPALTDRASLCVCPTGQYSQGEICKATACTPNQCIAGSINYCLADGQSLQTRCNQCGFTNCNQDQYGQSAIGCNPDSPAEPSQCEYPAVSGQGLLVQFSTLSYTQATIQCGDKIKSGSEQCDGNDFGGQSCNTVGSYSGGTLNCNADCTYNTGDCISIANSVKYRTSSTGYEVGGSIAWNPNALTRCDGTTLLTRYGKAVVGCDSLNHGEVPGTCATNLAGWTLLLDQSANIAGPFFAGTNKGCLYQSNTLNSRLQIRWYGDNTAGSVCSAKNQWTYYIYDWEYPYSISVENSPVQIDSSREVLC